MLQFCTFCCLFDATWEAERHEEINWGSLYLSVAKCVQYLRKYWVTPRSLGLHLVLLCGLKGWFLGSSVLLPESMSAASCNQEQEKRQTSQRRVLIWDIVTTGTWATGPTAFSHKANSGRYWENSSVIKFLKKISCFQTGKKSVFAKE